MKSYQNLLQKLLAQILAGQAVLGSLPTAAAAAKGTSGNVRRRTGLHPVAFPAKIVSAGRALTTGGLLRVAWKVLPFAKTHEFKTLEAMLLH